jgi:hypothetical protein
MPNPEREPGAGTTQNAYQPAARSPAAGPSTDPALAGQPDQAAPIAGSLAGAPRSARWPSRWREPPAGTASSSPATATRR